MVMPVRALVLVMAVIEQGHAVVMIPFAKLTGIVVAVITIGRPVSARVDLDESRLGVRLRMHGASSERYLKW
jgi:hypothetical protein